MFRGRIGYRPSGHDRFQTDRQLPHPDAGIGAWSEIVRSDLHAHALGVRQSREPNRGTRGKRSIGKLPRSCVAGSFLPGASVVALPLQSRVR